MSGTVTGIAAGAGRAQSLVSESALRAAAQRNLRIDGIRLIGEGQAGVPDDGSLESRRSLTLRTGEITVLMGANGAGKTRLLEKLAGLREADELQIDYGGEPLWTPCRTVGLRGRMKLNGKALLAYAYACQSPEEQLFLRTVREELRYSLRPYAALTETERDERLAAALGAVSWNGSWLERDPYLMSGGERRRTALACLFAPPADWLLLDEPTAGLDADGHELLGATLQRCAEKGQGVLLISHESDWALELADRILLLHGDGTLRCCGRGELLAHPEWLTEAGMDVPDWFGIAQLGLRLGVPERDVWDANKLAAALAGPSWQRKALAAAGGISAAQAPGPAAAGGTTAAQAPGLAAADGTAAAPARKPFALRASASRPSPIAAFDARAVWLTYIVLSSCMLQLAGWGSIGLAAALVACAIHFGRIPLRRWRGAIRAIATFTAAVSLIAGFGHQPSGGWWDVDPALASLQSLMKPLLVMLLGFGLPIAVTPLRLRRSLEQLFAVFGRMPAWGTKLLLTVTLLLRFVPVLLSEWERFGRISAARGKKTGTGLRGAFAKIQETALPFMLSLFRLGDQVTDALESRGVGVQAHPTVLVTEVWRLRDSLLVAAGTAAGLLLLL